MSKNVSEFVVDRMEAWGVKRIFGYPGDGIAGLDVAVDDADKAGRIKFVQVRHEEMAAFMADRAIVTADSGSAANWYARDLKSAAA